MKIECERAIEESERLKTKKPALLRKLIFDCFPPFFPSPKKSVTDRRTDGWTDRPTARPGRLNVGGFNDFFGVIST